jgi:hypothetical protein
MKMNIINLEKLEEPIKQVEDILNSYTTLEQDLLLRQVQDRFNRKRQQAKANEMSQNTIENMLPKGLMKMLRKDKNYEEQN